MKIDPNPITIAYAEDLVLIRRSIVGYINSNEHFKIMIEVNNGLELIDKLEKSEILPDICILDINMPVMNGYDTLLVIKKNWPSMKTLILTMYDDQYCIIRMLKEGANGFVTKSSNVEEMANALMGVYNNGFYYSEQVYPDLKEMSIPDIDDEDVKALSFFGSGLDDLGIAFKMGTDIIAVNDLANELMQKLNIKSRVGLFLFAQRIGIVPLD